MKKLLAVSVFVCCAAFLLFLPGCSAPNVEQKQDHGKSYAEIMNEKLVSFTDCANAFSDSVEQIADRKYAPSNSQIADIQKNLDRLEKACKELSGQNAPAAYSEAQSALDAAMADFSDAIDKCGSLLEFYSGYDDMFRQYDNPTEGSAITEKKERALYNEFAKAMQKASDSFRAACEKFSKAQ